MSARDVTQRADLAPAADMFRRAFHWSRRHAERAQYALRIYGDHGPQISGVIRDHFPDAIKDELREYCTVMNACADAAWKARPSRVRQSTMRALRDAIRAEVGAGFYL